MKFRHGIPVVEGVVIGEAFVLDAESYRIPQRFLKTKTSEAAEKEWVRWARDVEEVRAWRRPLWPLILVSLLILGIAVYVGLLLGGYLPVPGPLEGPVEWVWERWS